MQESLVRFARSSEASVLPHRPQATAIHIRLNAAGEGKLTRVSEIAGIIDVDIRRRVYRLQRNSGRGKFFGGVTAGALHRAASGISSETGLASIAVAMS